MFPPSLACEFGAVGKIHPCIFPAKSVSRFIIPPSWRMNLEVDMKQTFDSWTDYDNWLIQNYDKYAVVSLDEESGKVSAEYIEKSEWEAELKKNDPGKAGKS